MDTFVTNEAFDSEGFSFSKTNKTKNIILGALPLEEVSAQFIGRKRRETFLIVDEIISSHQSRVKPRCSEVPRCGGCVFQHFDYQAQLNEKQNRINQLFLEDQLYIRPIIASPRTFNYRAKMDFSFSQNKAGDKFLGLTQAKGNGRVMMTSQCHLAQPWMSEALTLVQKAFLHSSLKAYDRKQNGDLRCFILREGINTGEKMAILEVAAHQGSILKKEQLQTFFEPLRQLHPQLSCYLRVVQQIPKVPTQIYEMHLSGPESIHEKLVIDGKTFCFKISPSAFFQPNPFSAELLFNEIVSIVKKLNVKKICDLFCGTGTIGLSLASHVESCLSVEINPYAVFDAEVNAEMNNITNVSFIQKDAAVFVKDYSHEFDLIVVDPPRAGLGSKACELIDKFKARYILYVSCNPVTQAIDIKILKQKGYSTALIQPLDQFPHTNHLENIILLENLEA